MNELDKLKQEVKDARLRYLESVSSLSSKQGFFKPSEDVWSAAEITEHLFHAELGGIWGMWKALEGSLNGNPTWKEAHHNKGQTIEEVIDKTWKPKEQVPESAAPKLGGPIRFWMNALDSCQHQLERLAESLNGHTLENLIYPHPISGPLDIRQRFEFLRFHMDRHKEQVENLKMHPDFPKS